MCTAIYIDPKIDISSEESYQVIIEFNLPPAHVAYKGGSGDLTLEEAEEKVEKSHSDFQEELVDLLEKKKMTYHITQRYKKSLNGVAMNLSGKAVRELLSSQVIKAIHIDEKIYISKKIMDTGYQI